jgi:hypothetical protein
MDRYNKDNTRHTLWQDVIPVLWTGTTRINTRHTIWQDVKPVLWTGTTMITQGTPSGRMLNQFYGQEQQG